MLSVLSAYISQHGLWIRMTGVTCFGVPDVHQTILRPRIYKTAASAHGTSHMFFKVVCTNIASHHGETTNNKIILHWLKVYTVFYWHLGWHWSLSNPKIKSKLESEIIFPHTFANLTFSSHCLWYEPIIYDHWDEVVMNWWYNPKNYHENNQNDLSNLL